MSNLFSEELVTNFCQNVSYLGSKYHADKNKIAFDGFCSTISIRIIIEQLNVLIKNPSTSRLTRDRCKKQVEAYTDIFQFVFEFYQPLGIEQFQFQHYQEALSSGRKLDNIMDYWHNLFRDWCTWGNEEIDINLKILDPLLSQVSKDSTVLFLGAGACRLPYEVHRRILPTKSFCLDYNPILLSLASRIIQGERFNLFSFPRHPLNLEAFTITEELACPAEAIDNMYFVCNNFFDWQVKEESFDLIVTFWFIDIIDQDIKKSISLIKKSLKKGGKWINLGPLCFNPLDIAHFYSIEEVENFINKENFETLHSSTHRVPFMEHPSSASWRKDRIFVYMGEKI